MLLAQSSTLSGYTSSERGLQHKEQADGCHLKSVLNWEKLRLF